MAVMLRKQIYLNREQDEKIKRRAAATGLTESEVIRQAIDRGLEMPRVVPPKGDAWERELEYVKARMARGPLPGKRDWTREELYDR